MLPTSSCNSTYWNNSTKDSPRLLGPPTGGETFHGSEASFCRGTADNIVPTSLAAQSMHGCLLRLHNPSVQHKRRGGRATTTLHSASYIPRLPHSLPPKPHLLYMQLPLTRTYSPAILLLYRSVSEGPGVTRLLPPNNVSGADIVYLPSIESFKHT